MDLRRHRLRRASAQAAVQRHGELPRAGNPPRLPIGMVEGGVPATALEAVWQPVPQFDAINESIPMSLRPGAARSGTPGRGPRPGPPAPHVVDKKGRRFIGPGRGPTGRPSPAPARSCGRPRAEGRIRRTRAARPGACPASGPVDGHNRHLGRVGMPYLFEQRNP